MGHGFTSPPKEGMLCIFSPEKSNDFGFVNIINWYAPCLVVLMNY
jgi:hypothetical protein